MTRNIFIFLGMFVAGALIALVARAAMFAPHAEHEGHPPAGGDYAAMVSNPLAPANVTETERNAMPSAPAPVVHANHSPASMATTVDSSKPVNTVCAICGMDVDPNLPTLEYQGKRIGFGCKMCPAKFKADPDRYGPFYLRNEVIKK